MNKDGLFNLFTEQVDEKPMDLYPEQVGAEPVDLYTEQVGGKPMDLYTEQVGKKPVDLYPEQVGEKAVDLYPEQVGPLKSLSETQWRIVSLCEVPRNLAEIMGELGLSSRGKFKTRHLDPLLRGNVIKMTNPENPRASNQKYVLTETGIQLKINRTKGKT